MRINRDEQLSFSHSWESECSSCSLKDGQVSWRNLSVEICYFSYDKNKPMHGMWWKVLVLCFLLDSSTPAPSVEKCVLFVVFNRNRQVSLYQVIARCLDACISCVFPEERVCLKGQCVSWRPSVFVFSGKSIYQALSWCEIWRYVWITYIYISILYVSECCTVKGTRNIQRVFMALKLFCMVL